MISPLVTRLCGETLLNYSEVETIIRSAPLRYKVYEIPKKKKGEMRVIAQPTPIIKTFQRIIVEKYLQDLPLHYTVTAYQKGSSIKKNAKRHQKNQYLLKMDFKNFFPSITPEDFKLYLKDQTVEIFEPDDVERVVRILFRKIKDTGSYELSIGAPSSPHVSNILLFNIDSIISGYCKTYNVIYTRYADDLIFSTNEKNTLNKIETLVYNTIKDSSYPKLIINKNKTVYASKKNRRRITGLIITNDNTISIGRDRKRIINAMVHKLTLRRLTEEDKQKLKGLLSFINDVEPDFIERLEIKYKCVPIWDLFNY